MMSGYKGNLFTRDDTFFGVCEGLGEDLRIPSNLLRVGFAVAFFFNPVLVVASYFGLGVLVLATRLLSPDPRRRAAKAAAKARAAAMAEQPSTELAVPAQEELVELELAKAA